MSPAPSFVRYRSRPHRLAVGAPFALALAVPALLAATPGVTTDEMTALLRRSDVAANGPASFRSRILLQDSATPDSVEIEVWRDPESRTLVRFLGAQHRGKYLLYLEQGVFFLAPGAREPVKLPRSFRLYGSATLDNVLGLRYSRDFSIESAAADADGTHVVFELRARDAHAQYPQVRYVVERATGHPTRAELRLKGGKLATTIEFVAWARTRPLRLVLRDELRGGRETRIELLSLEERPVPEGLFSLSDGAARRRLEELEPPTRP